MEPIVNKFTSILESNKSLELRVENSNEKLDGIRSELKDCEHFKKNDIQIFCAGSLGRGDVGRKSDLDLFTVSDTNKENRGNLEDLEVLAKLISINRKLKYPPFSNDGQFLKIHSIDEMTCRVGDPRDDSENLFTTRMLMLLESKPIYNEALYNEHLKKIIAHYIRDKDGHPTFKPIFIINDLLRYWRTLCLNYEIIRNDTGRNWRKKNINLKFSRALTVFSAVLVILKLKTIDEEKLLKVFELTPMMRLAHGLDLIGDNDLLVKFESILNDYENFLEWKEDEAIDKAFKKKDRDHAKVVASRFSDFLYEALMHESIDPSLKKILVV